MNAKVIIQIGEAEAEQEFQIEISAEDASPRAHEALRAAASSLGVHIPK